MRSFRRGPGGWGVGIAALLVVASAPAVGIRAQEPTPGTRAVQPGAPGEASRALTAEDLTVPERARHTEADVLFMQNMIHHHQQALVMSSLAPERAEREDLRRLAARIHRSQSDEIALMRRWLELRGEEAPAEDAMHGHLHPGHGDGRLMAGILTEEQLAALAAARGREFDRLFLEFMIYHHEGALEMVDELFASRGAAQDTDIFRFASHVNSDQRMEIARMEEMLRRGG